MTRHYTNHQFLTNYNTVKTRIKGPCARALELSLLVRSGFFSLLICPGGGFLSLLSAPISEEEILDYLTHGPFIRVFTVLGFFQSGMSVPGYRPYCLVHELKWRWWEYILELWTLGAFPRSHKAALKQNKGNFLILVATPSKKTGEWRDNEGSRGKEKEKTNCYSGSCHLQICSRYSSDFVPTILRIASLGYASR